MRKYLLTRFLCARCGSPLAVTKDVPVEQPDYMPSFEREPTGAEVAGFVVGIEPCRSCMAPLDEMRAAVRTLLGSERG